MKLNEFKQKKDEFILYIKVERNLAINTQKAYASDLNQFIAFWQNLSENEKKTLPLRQTIERFLVSLFYKKIDKASIARKFSCFTSFEKFLKPQGIELSLQLTRPRLDKKLPIYLSLDEITHILDNVKPENIPSKHPLRDKAIFELLYATGVRCSELINIKMIDIDFGNKTIRIFGKGRTERIVLFGKKAKDIVLNYIKKERKFIGSQQEALFLNYRNQKLSSRSVQRIIEMFRSFLKIGRNITPHKIRHSFATHLLNRGVDLRVVQELLGHKVLSSTEKYTHVSLEQLSKTCNKSHPLKKLLKTKVN
ncbi:tyrosine-type recombinase/integrase [bacterium]|nr:tyrosine-type recombinase/integrase [bacterium]